MVTYQNLQLSKMGKDLMVAMMSAWEDIKQNEFVIGKNTVKKMYIHPIKN